MFCLNCRKLNWRFNVVCKPCRKVISELDIYLLKNETPVRDKILKEKQDNIEYINTHRTKLIEQLLEDNYILTHNPQVLIDLGLKK